MKFLADVNIPQSVIIALVRLGHDVVDVKKQNLNYKDVEIVRLALEQERIILSRDKDFIALTQFPKYRVPAIVIRLKNQAPDHIKKYVLEFLKNQKKAVLKKSLTIIREESADSYPFDSLEN